MPESAILEKLRLRKLEREYKIKTIANNGQASTKDFMEMERAKKALAQAGGKGKENGEEVVGAKAEASKWNWTQLQLQRENQKQLSLSLNQVKPKSERAIQTQKIFEQQEAEYKKILEKQEAANKSELVSKSMSSSSSSSSSSSNSSSSSKNQKDPANMNILDFFNVSETTKLIGEVKQVESGEQSKEVCDNDEQQDKNEDGPPLKKQRTK